MAERQNQTEEVKGGWIPERLEGLDAYPCWVGFDATDGTHRALVSVSMGEGYEFCKTPYDADRFIKGYVNMLHEMRGVIEKHSKRFPQLSELEKDVEERLMTAFLENVWLTGRNDVLRSFLEER